MQGDEQDRIARLTPRQRQCLELVFARKRTGQIASALDLSPGTVNGYIQDAIRTLGARDRIDAAERLAAWQDPGSTPDKLPVQSLGVADEPPPPPSIDHGPGASWWRSVAPYRSKGAHQNDLGIIARLVWIPILALVFAVGFGALADTLRVASALVAGR